MTRNITSLMLVAIVVILSGCAIAPDYKYESPMVQTVRDSDGRANSRRGDESSVRFEPYTTLGSSVKQAAPVQITVTFSYSSARSATSPKVGNCMMHIKSSDTSLADVQKCKIEPAGNTFIVTFKSDDGYKSFDLHALGGYYDGGRPMYYTGNIVSIGLSSARKQVLRYIYLGPDPFDLPRHEEKVEKHRKSRD